MRCSPFSDVESTVSSGEAFESGFDTEFHRFLPMPQYRRNPFERRRSRLGEYGQFSRGERGRWRAEESEHVVVES